MAWGRQEPDNRLLLNAMAAAHSRGVLRLFEAKELLDSFEDRLRRLKREFEPSWEAVQTLREREGLFPPARL